METRYTSIARALSAAGVVALLAGCGGGGGSASVSTGAISGVAASGAPITGGGSGTMNGVVTLKDSSSPAHTVTTATDGNGNYAFTAAQIQGFTPPFMLQIDYKLGGVGYSLASAVTAADVTGGNATINITPLTDLVIANLGHQIAATIFANGNYANLLTPAALAAGVAALDAELQPVLAQQGVSGSIDLLHQAFTANGSGLDAVLDSLHVTVDPATGSETLTNTTTGQSVTGTLSAPPTTPLPAGSSNNVTDLQAITATFNSVGSLLATSPSASDPALLAFFDQTSFRDNGQSLGTFLQNITTTPAVAGGTITFQDIELSAVPSWVTTVPSGATAYKVKFTVLQNQAPNSRNAFIAYKNTSGNWVFLGNQKIASADIVATNASVAGVQCAGFDVEITDKGGIGLTYAIVTGPQLPASGLLYVATGSGQSLQLAAGAPSTYNGTATPLLQNANTLTNTCSQSIAGQTVPTDDTMLAAITLPSSYTLALYTGSSPATDTPVATYHQTLDALPLNSTQVAAADFASAINATPTPQALFASGGTLNVSWTAPAASGLYASNLEAFLCANVVSGNTTNTQCDNYGDQLIPGQVSASLSVAAAPGGSTLSGYGVQLSYLDTVFRQFWTSP